MRKSLLLITITILLSITTASAYVIPSEYRDQARNEVEVYILASQHESEPWASAILYDQMCQNVGCKAVNGKEKLNKQMEYNIQFYSPRMPEMPLIGN